MEEIEKSIRINSLFDKYAVLLSKSQQKMISLYYQDDLSLGEIAELEGISRNGVYDSIKKGTKLLEEYERKLGLIAKEESINDIIYQLLDLDLSRETRELIEKIKERVNE